MRTKSDGFFAENGIWYAVGSSNSWGAYISAEDAVTVSNQQSGGTSSWSFSDGFFAADNSYYVIDSTEVWRQFSSAADLFANTNQVASGIGIRRRRQI